MLSSMYKTADLVLVGTGIGQCMLTVGGFFFSGLGEWGVCGVHSERAFFLLGGFCGRVGYVY